jgi:hypothetical protein
LGFRTLWVRRSVAASLRWRQKEKGGTAREERVTESDTSKNDSFASCRVNQPIKDSQEFERFIEQTCPKQAVESGENSEPMFKQEILLLNN